MFHFSRFTLTSLATFLLASTPAFCEQKEPTGVERYKQLLEQYKPVKETTDFPELQGFKEDTVPPIKMNKVDVQLLLKGFAGFDEQMESGSCRVLLLAAEEKDKSFSVDEEIAKFAFHNKELIELRKDILLHNVLKSRLQALKLKSGSHPIILKWVTQNPNHPALWKFLNLMKLSNDTTDYSTLFELAIDPKTKGNQGHIQSHLCHIARRSKNKKRLSSHLRQTFTNSDTLKKKLFCLGIIAETATKEDLKLITDTLSSAKGNTIQRIFRELNSTANPIYVPIILNKVKQLPLSNNIRLNGFKACSAILNSWELNDTYKDHKEFKYIPNLEQYHEAIVSAASTDAERLEAKKVLRYKDKANALKLLKRLHQEAGPEAKKEIEKAIERFSK